MSSTVQHFVLTRPLVPDLGSVTSIAAEHSCHNTSYARDGVYSKSERLPYTPTSSDPASERVDPVALLSRPVDGFHHPRQHFFTDRLIGRFYEDGSLDAETRKTSKCLAGRLGTAGTAGSSTAGISTRPNTTTSNTTCPPCRSPHSPAASSRRSKRMHASALARSLGREGAATLPGGVAGMGTGLSGRKEQVEKEIMEQKALIERLEGQMASLSSGGRRTESGDTGRGSTAPPQEEVGGDFHREPNVNVDDRPATTPEPERDVEQAGDQRDQSCGYGVKANSSVGELGSRDDCCLGGSSGAATLQPVAGKGSSRQQAGKLQGENLQTGKGTVLTQAAEHEHKSRRTNTELHNANATCDSLLSERQQEYSAVTIQRNLRRAGKRNTFLSLQSAREVLEQHLQEMMSLAASPGRQTDIEERVEAVPSGEEKLQVGAGISREQEGVYASVVSLLKTSREDGLAKPPFEILGAMYRGVEQLKAALLLFSTAAMNSGHDVANNAGICMLESCGAAERALEDIRDALGCPDLGCTPPSRKLSASEKVALFRDHHLPAGSGRAAAVATASARGGLLVSPDSPGRQERSQDRSSGTMQATFVTEEAELERGGGPGRRKDGDEMRCGSRSSRAVPLRSLGVNDVGALLRAHGFGEHAPRFVAQAVDGVMLSDPNLCETDLVELSLGSDDCRPLLVSFFRRCQEDGAVGVPEDFSSLSPSPASPLFERVKSPVQADTQGGNSVPASLARLTDSASENIQEVRAADAVGNGDREGSVSAARSSSWRSGSVQVNRENQDEIANIVFDANHGTQETVTGEKVRQDGRRMSVKLNRGVVVTMGGQQADLVSSVDGFGGVEIEEETSGDGAHVEPSAGRRRRASVGFPTVSLDSDAGGEGPTAARAARDAELPPGVAVKAADVTINVFR